MPPLMVRRSAAPVDIPGLQHLPAREPGPSSDSSSSTASSSSLQLDVRLPSRVLPLNIRLPPSRIHPRQNSATQTITTIPATYGSLYSSPDPGTVVGITLGSVGGFVLVLWLIYTFINLGNPDTASSYGTASVVSRRSRRRSTRRHSHRHKSRSPLPMRETVEIRTSRGGGPVVVEEPPPRVVSGERIERVVLEETRRTASRARGKAPNVEDDSSDDEVVVIEEHSPPRRHRSTRRSSSPRRESGYREVEPDRFGGGDRPIRGVRRGSGSQRR